MSRSAQRLTLHEALEQAILVEEAIGGLYRELQRRFSHHPGAVALWKAMAADEDGHAQMLRQVQERSSPELLGQLATGETGAKIASVIKLIDTDPLTSVSTLEDAYDLAHRLESSEVNSVLQFLVTEAVPGDLEPDFIRGHITVHQKRLADFRQVLDSPEWTRVKSQVPARRP